MNAPLLISTWSFGQRGNRAAWPILESGGSALDAVEHAASAVEADSEVDSVGFGGLPDATGEVSLDASIMLSPSRCGSVCYVRNYLEVTSIARRVMERSPHIMLAGEGAERFAAAEGFTRRNLFSDAARTKWQEWRSDPAQSAPDQSRDSGASLPSPSGRGAGGEGALGSSLRPIDTGAPALFDESSWKNLHDTIGVLALDSHGVLAGACSTSGLPYKLPGRVGDSPIIGHGLYVDPAAGAAVATGTGELIMGICGSFLIVELMRSGASPQAAIEEALERIEKNYVLRPEHQAAFIALRPDGEWSSGAVRPGFKTSIMTSASDSIADASVTLRRD